MLDRVVQGVAGVALALFLAGAAWLGRLEGGGPARVDVPLDGGVPATLYLPDERPGRAAVLDPPPYDERPPAVLLVHGFASDRLFVSTLARRLAGVGYAVLAIDLRGHGENRNPFARGLGRPDAFDADLSLAVDFLRASPLVDASRLALVGHSMGAGAVLDFATRDSAIDAAVLVSGGWTTLGPYRPPNAFFVYAEGDPPRIRERVLEIAARVAGVDAVEDGRVYGDFEQRSAVRAFEVAGTDHGRILWNAEAALEIASWLHTSFGRDGAPAPPEDPRLAVAGGLFALVLLILPGLGQLVGRLAPRAASLPAAGRAQGLVALAVTLVATLPLLAVGTPGRVLSVEVGDIVVSHLALTGIALLAASAAAGTDLRPLLRGLGSAWPAAAVGLVGVYSLLFPTGVVLHRMSLTPERMAVFVACSLALLPFAFAFNVLLRRGPPLTAALFALAGRLFVLAAFVLGVRVGVLGGVVLLMLPALVLVALLFELLAAPIYTRSRHLPTLTLIDATWLAFVIASGMPIRL